MNVGELIARLQTFDPSLRVTCRGYEGGADDVLSAEEVSIEVNANSAWYYGAHEVIYSGRAEGPVERAIYLEEGRPTATPAEEVTRDQS